MILHVAINKAAEAALLVTICAYDERGARGNGQKLIQELEDKHLGVSNETIPALQKYLAATIASCTQEAFKPAECAR